MSYDSWLERPYQEAAAQSDEYQSYCEDFDLDPEEDHWAMFEEWKDSMSEPDPDDERDRWLEDRYDYDDTRD